MTKTSQTALTDYQAQAYKAKRHNIIALYGAYIAIGERAYFGKANDQLFLAQAARHIVFG